MNGTGCIGSRDGQTYKPLTPGCACNGSEAHMLEQMRKGDARAFEDFVTRHQHALQRRARHLVWDDMLSQDVVQETWLAVIRGIRNFEGRSSLKTWVYKILENRAMTIIQREKRNVSLSTARSTEAGDDSENDHRPGRNPAHGMMCRPFQSELADQEALMMAQENFFQVKNAILGLPRRRRRVLELRIFRGYSAQSVSKILRITQGNQRVLLHRARLGLKHALVAPTWRQL